MSNQEKHAIRIFRWITKTYAMFLLFIRIIRLENKMKNWLINLEF